jgi:hypothetical protein
MLCLCNVFAEDNLRFLQDKILKNLEYSGVFNDKDIIFKFEESSKKFTMNYDGEIVDGVIGELNDKVYLKSGGFSFKGKYDNKFDLIVGDLYFKSHRQTIRLTANAIKPATVSKPTEKVEKELKILGSTATTTNPTTTKEPETEKEPATRTNPTTTKEPETEKEPATTTNPTTTKKPETEKKPATAISLNGMNFYGRGFLGHRDIIANFDIKIKSENDGKFDYVIITSLSSLSENGTGYLDVNGKINFNSNSYKISAYYLPNNDEIKTDSRGTRYMYIPAYVLTLSNSVEYNGSCLLRLNL